MATCSDIILRALRMARIVALGDEPTVEEENEGMNVLKSLYQRWADTSLATSTETYESDDYEALEGERVYCLGAVTLPTTISDGTTRRPADLAAVQYNENDGDGWQTWISDRGDWVRIDDLTDDDDAPFASRNQEGLAALVAMELAPTFGKELSAVDLMKARRFQSQMQPIDPTANEYF